MATEFFDNKWAIIGMWFWERCAAEYFDTSHQVFAQLDSRTVETQNEQLSVTAIKYSSELKLAYDRVRIRVKLGRPYSIVTYAHGRPIYNSCAHTSTVHE